MVSINFYGKHIEMLKIYQQKRSNKNHMIEKKRFFPKYYSHTSLNTSKIRLLRPFS